MELTRVESSLARPTATGHENGRMVNWRVGLKRGTFESFSYARHWSICSRFFIPASHMWREAKEGIKIHTDTHHTCGSTHTVNRTWGQLMARSSGLTSSFVLSLLSFLIRAFLLKLSFPLSHTLSPSPSSLSLSLSLSLFYFLQSRQLSCFDHPEHLFQRDKSSVQNRQANDGWFVNVLKVIDDELRGKKKEKESETLGSKF